MLAATYHPPPLTRTLYWSHPRGTVLTVTLRGDGVMKQRTFLTACVPVSATARFAFAQQPGGVKRLGRLSAGTLPVGWRLSGPATQYVASDRNALVRNARRMGIVASEATSNGICVGRLAC